MEKKYSLKYKNGDIEIEIESTDRAFVGAELKELVLLEKLNQSPDIKNALVDNSTLTSTEVVEEDLNNIVNVNDVVMAINASDKKEMILKEIINKSNRLRRILLILYFTNELYGHIHITTGDIKLIAEQLGIKISSGNVASSIREKIIFFAAESVKKKNIITKYKINNKGIQEINAILGIK